MNRKAYICIAIPILIVATIAVTVRSESFRIWYHKRAMRSAHDAVYSSPSTITAEGLVGYGNNELFDLHRYHRDQLVELGYYFHARYEISSLPDVDGVQTAFWKRVYSEFSGSPDFTLSRSDNVLDVWDYPSQRAAWDAFVEKYNVADFVELYMRDSPE